MLKRNMFMVHTAFILGIRTYFGISCFNLAVGQGYSGKFWELFILLWQKENVACTISTARRGWITAEGATPRRMRTMTSATTASPSSSETRKRCSENSSVAPRLASYLLVKICTVLIISWAEFLMLLFISIQVTL